VRTAGKEQIRGFSRECTVSADVWNLAESDLDSEKSVSGDRPLGFKHSVDVDAKVVEGPDEASIRVLREDGVQEKGLGFSSDDVFAVAERLEQRAYRIAEFRWEVREWNEGKDDCEVRDLIDRHDEVAFRIPDRLRGPDSQLGVA